MHCFKNVPEELKNELLLYTEVATYFLFENSFEIADHVFDKVIDYSGATTFDEIAELTQSIYKLVEDLGIQGDKKRVEKTRSDYNRYMKVAHASCTDHKIAFSMEPTTVDKLHERTRSSIGSYHWKEWITFADIYYTFEDLVHLYLHGVLKLRFTVFTDKPSPYHNAKDMDAVLSNIASTSVENLTKAKFDVSWNGSVDSPLEVRDLMWYCKSKDPLASKPRSYPTEVLVSIVSEIKNDPSNEAIRRLWFENSGARKLIDHLQRSLFRKAEALKPKKKKTRRMVAKKLINSVFTSLRRKGFIALDIQFPEDIVYWDEDMRSKLEQMEDDIENGNRKSLPTKYICYDRRNLKHGEVELLLGFITGERYNYRLEALHTRANGLFGLKSNDEDGKLVNLVIDEFKKKGIDAEIGRLLDMKLTNLNKLIDQQMD